MAALINTPSDVGKWHPRAPLAGFVETWWVRIPGKLRPYSRILWAAWGDGTCLTAWPRAATILPLAALLLGLAAGATHLSPLTIADRVSSSIPAVAFLQMVPLLFLGVFLGSLSANLGLTLVIGYGLGDLIAGPALTVARPGLLSTFFELRVPQLLSYALFFGLVVTPLVLSNTLLSPLCRRISARRLPGALLRTAASATVMMLLVYGWTLMAPFALRVMWSWPGQIPPVTPSSFRNTLDPWLPLVAGAAVVLRAVLTWRTRRDQLVVERIARLRRDAERADQNLKWTRRCPPWARSIATAAASTLLTAAMLSTWALATMVFFGFLLLDFLRRSVLPRVGLWKWWTAKVMIAPLILRLGASVVLMYYITLEVLRVPGWAANANGIPGQFGAELASLGLGVVVTFFLTPAAPAALPAALTPARLPRSAMRATAVMMLVACALFATPEAFAICLDPSCCFGDNPNAALAVAAMGLGLGGMGMGPGDDTGDDGGAGGGPTDAAGGEGASQGGAAGSGDGGGAGDAAGSEGASEGGAAASGDGGGASDAAGGEGASEGGAAAGGDGGGAGDAAGSEGASEGGAAASGDGGGASDAAGGEGASEGGAAAGGDGGGAGDAAGSEGASEGGAAASGDGGGAGDQAQAQLAAAEAQAEAQAAAQLAEQEAAQAQAQAEADAALAQAQAQATADAQATAQAQAQLAAAEAQAEAQAAAQLAEQEAAQAQAQAEADAALAQAQASSSQNSTSGNSSGGSGSSNPDISNYEEEKPLKNPNDP